MNAKTPYKGMRPIELFFVFVVFGSCFVAWLLVDGELDSRASQHEPLSAVQIAQVSGCVRWELRERAVRTGEVLTQRHLRAAEAACEGDSVRLAQRKALSVTE